MGDDASTKERDQARRGFEGTPSASLLAGLDCAGGPEGGTRIGAGVGAGLPALHAAPPPVSKALFWPLILLCVVMASISARLWFPASSCMLTIENPGRSTEVETVSCPIRAPVRSLLESRRG